MVLTVAIRNDQVKDEAGVSEGTTETKEEDTLRDRDPAAMKRDLPGQDPGTTYQPQQWSGKIGKRA